MKSLLRGGTVEAQALQVSSFGLGCQGSHLATWQPMRISGAARTVRAVSCNGIGGEETRRGNMNKISTDLHSAIGVMKGQQLL